MSEEKKKYWDKEVIHDEQIAPLVAKLIEICKEHGVPLMCVLQYQNTEQTGPGHSSTILLDGNQSQDMTDLALFWRPAEAAVIVETVVTGSDGSKMVSVGRLEGGRLRESMERKWATHQGCVGPVQRTRVKLAGQGSVWEEDE